MAQRRPTPDLGTLPEIYEPTWEEGRALFDDEARRLLGISGEEFLRRLDAGEYDDIEEDEVGRKIVHLLISLPFVRPVTIGG